MDDGAVVLLGKRASAWVPTSVANRTAISAAA